jgi:hypothetical protein
MIWQLAGRTPTGEVRYRTYTQSQKRAESFAKVPPFDDVTFTATLAKSRSLKLITAKTGTRLRRHLTKEWSLI